jgi:hypothetical protein
VIVGPVVQALVPFTEKWFGGRPGTPCLHEHTWDITVLAPHRIEVKRKSLGFSSLAELFAFSLANVLVPYIFSQLVQRALKETAKSI